MHTHTHTPSTPTQHLAKKKKKKIFPRKHLQKLSFYLLFSHRASAELSPKPSPSAAGLAEPGPQRKPCAGTTDRAAQGTCQASYSHVLHISPHHLGGSHSCP